MAWESMRWTIAGTVLDFFVTNPNPDPQVSKDLYQMFKPMNIPDPVLNNIHTLCMKHWYKPGVFVKYGSMFGVVTKLRTDKTSLYNAIRYPLQIMRTDGYIFEYSLVSGVYDEKLLQNTDYVESKIQSGEAKFNREILSPKDWQAMWDQLIQVASMDIPTLLSGIKNSQIPQFAISNRMTKVALRKYIADMSADDIFAFATSDDYQLIQSVDNDHILNLAVEEKLK